CALLRQLPPLLHGHAVRLAHAVGPFDRRPEEVGVTDLLDGRARHQPEPRRLPAARVDLASVLSSQIVAGRLDVPDVDHRLPLALLAKDLVDLHGRLLERHASYVMCAAYCVFRRSPLSTWWAPSEGGRGCGERMTYDV